MPKMIGAEGQSRTDTGSPQPVFEFGAGPLIWSQRTPSNPVP